jgi:hypothetical protein
MHPGRACLSCHTASGGPSFSVAGTVYPASHDEDDCNGVAGVQIVLTDANGQTETLTSNAAGNFHLASPLAAPLSVKLVNGGKERVMTAHAPSGDCNSCHTQAGASGAPGRLLAP